MLPQAPNPQPYPPNNEPSVPATEPPPVAHTPATDISSGPSSSTLPRATGSPPKHHHSKDQSIPVRSSKSALDPQPSTMVHQSLSSQSTHLWSSSQPQKIHTQSWDYVDATTLPAVPTTQVHYQRGQYPSEKRENPSATNHLPSNGP